MALWIWEMPLKLETCAAPSATRAANQWFWPATCRAVRNNAGLGNGGKSASQSILFHWLTTSQLTKYTKEIQYVTSANYQLTFWCLVASNWPLCCIGSCLVMQWAWSAQTNSGFVEANDEILKHPFLLTRNKVRFSYFCTSQVLCLRDKTFFFFLCVCKKPQCTRNVRLCAGAPLPK